MSGKMLPPQPEQGKNGEDMASNFDFLLGQKDYKAIAKVAMEAERQFGASYPKCVILAERAVKLAAADAAAGHGGAFAHCSMLLVSATARRGMLRPGLRQSASGTDCQSLPWIS